VAHGLQNDRREIEGSISAKEESMKSATWMAVVLLGAAPAARAQTVELAEVADSIEKPGGGDAINFSVRAPKGAQAAPKMVQHMRAFGRDVSGGRISISLTRYNDELKDVASIIRYKASTYGGLDTQQEVEKGAYYVAVLKPMGGLQSVFAFKKAKAGYVEMECSGPPAHGAALKDACVSLKLP
jgi:hypothetical protein